MASPHEDLRNKQVRRFVVLYLGMERDHFVNTYLEQLPPTERSEFIRQALYTAVRNAPRQLRLPLLGEPADAEPELPPATLPEMDGESSENALVAALLAKSDNVRLNQMLARFARTDLETGEDLVELVRDLLWRHYTGEQAATPTPPPSQDAKRQATLSAKLKKLSFAALTQ
jgi:hypothetical protein